MKQQPNTSIEQILTERMKLQRLNNGVWVYACEPM
jgi:hypothetical protein